MSLLIGIPLFILAFFVFLGILIVRAKPITEDYEKILDNELKNRNHGHKKATNK